VLPFSIMFLHAQVLPFWIVIYSFGENFAPIARFMSLRTLGRAHYSGIGGVSKDDRS
jgi:hypothetical protein